jgi:hypothetical protein
MNVRINVQASLVILPAAVFAMLALGLWAWFARTWRGHMAAAALTVGCAGGVLLMMAGVGALTPVRMVNIGDTSPFYGDQVRFDYETFREMAARRPGEDAGVYLIRLNEAINGAVMHSAPPSGRFEPSIFDNWIMRVLADIKPAFRDYIFWDPYRTVQRGFGLCGHVSSAFVGIARGQGVDARIVTLNGHVVATGEVAPGEWHIFDPDLGVHIAASLGELEQNEALLRAGHDASPTWLRARSAYPDFTASIIAAYLTPADNHIDPLGRESYHSGWRVWGLHHSEVERWADIAVFALPLALIGFGGLLALPLLVFRRGARKPLPYHPQGVAMPGLTPAAGTTLASDKHPV